MLVWCITLSLSDRNADSQSYIEIFQLNIRKNQESIDRTNIDLRIEDGFLLKILIEVLYQTKLLGRQSV